MKIVVKLICIFLLVTLSGCGVVLESLLPMDDMLQADDSEVQSQTKLQAFRDLLEQGWEIRVYNNKVILIKQTQSGLLINDVFNVLKGE